MTRTIALALSMAFLACTSLFGPEIIHHGLRPMDPVPEEYEPWYHEVATCWNKKGVHTSREFGDVRWMTANEITIDRVGRARGTTNGDRIVIVMGSILIERTVKHEMSHHYSGRGNSIHSAGGHRAVCDE